MSSRRPRLLVSPKMRNKIGLTHHRAIGGRRSINKRFGIGNAAVVKASAAKIFAAASAACGVPVDQATQRGNIKVVVRVRPPNVRESAPAYRTVVVAVDEKLILFDPKEEQNEFYYHGVKQRGNRDMLKKQHKDLKFCFDQVYGQQHNNEIIFQGTIVPMLDTLLNGFNCSVFAYGATGAGKTFTMLGTQNSPGLTFLTVMELYRRLGEMTQDYEAEVVVAYLEVYNEQVRDLLSSESVGSLNVLENASQGIYINNLSMHKPENESQLLQMLAHGNSRRSQHPTDQNSESSRSHAVFQVFITLRSRFTDMKTNLKVAKLVMVDLAGSERGAATGFEGARFREGASINKSLLALGNCINALADGKRHIPFRDSKLTRILKDSLGGNCKTVMIANVSPSDISYDDTYNTLRYADRAKRIRFQVKKNIMSVSACISKYGKVVEEMTEKIENLKKQLEDKDKACHCSIKKVDTSTELSESFYERELEDAKENIDPGPMDATTTIDVKSTPLNETFTAAVVSTHHQPLFDHFEELSEKERMQRRDCIKVTNTWDNEQRKCNLKLNRIQLVESFGSLDRMNNLKRLEKMNKQLESKMSTSSLLKSRMLESKQRLSELNGELTAVKQNLDATVKPDQIVKTLTLHDMIKLEELKSDLDARKISEAHLQKVMGESQDEASHSNAVIQQCEKILLPLFKIVRQNGQLTESMDNDYNDLMASLCGAKVHWAANRETSNTTLTEVNANVPMFGNISTIHINE